LIDDPLGDVEPLSQFETEDKVTAETEDVECGSIKVAISFTMVDSTPPKSSVPSSSSSTCVSSDMPNFAQFHFMHQKKKPRVKLWPGSGMAGVAVG